MIRNRLDIVFQAEESECGLACLAMVSLYNKGIYGINQLRTLYGSTRGGISITDLVRFASSIGVRLVPERADNITNINSSSFPCIALWEDSHLVILDKKKPHTISVYDPAYGQADLTEEEAEHYFSNIYLKVRLIDSVFSRRSNEDTIFTRLMRIIRVLRSRVGLGVVLISAILLAISSAFTVGNAQVQDVFFNWIVEMQMKQWATPLGYIQIITGILSSLSLLALSLYVAQRYAIISLRWNNGIFKRMLCLPDEYFLNRRTGDTISRFNYADGILRSSQTSLIKFVVAFVNLAVLFLILLMTDGTLLVLALTASVLAIGVTIAFNPKQRATQKELQHSTAYVDRLLYDLITDFEQIRLEGREQYFLNQIGSSEGNRISQSNRLSYVYIQEDFVLQLLDSITTVLMLIAAGIVIVSGRLTLGQYAAIDVLLSTSLSPLMNLSGVIRTLQETEVAFKRLSDITDCPIDRRYDPSFIPEPARKSWSSLIEMNNISYSYSIFSSRILQDCNLSLSTDDFPVLIQGKSGSGKSTLARILSGRVLPSHGHLEIFGHDIRKMSASGLNKHILLVDGLPFIRGASILDNLRLGSSASTSKIMEIVDYLGISDLPLFSTLNRHLSSSFRDLSGGELVLLQIIRCLSQEPEILVLDESVSAISPAYRSKVVAGIVKCCSLSIFISHEVHDTISFGSCYRLANGKLELVSKKGLYLSS